MKNRKNILSSFWKTGAILSVALTGLYLYQITRMANNIFSIRECDKDIEIVLEQRRKTEYNFLSYNSLDRVEALIDDYGFEKTDNIDYIKISNTQVASR